MDCSKINQLNHRKARWNWISLGFGSLNFKPIRISINKSQIIHYPDGAHGDNKTPTNYQPHPTPYPLPHHRLLHPTPTQQLLSYPTPYRILPHTSPASISIWNKKEIKAWRKTLLLISLFRAENITLNNLYLHFRFHLMLRITFHINMWEGFNLKFWWKALNFLLYWFIIYEFSRPLVHYMLIYNTPAANVQICGIQNTECMVVNLDWWSYVF